MSDNLVPLNNNEENVFEFELSVQGLNEKNIDAKFVIRSAEMDLAFPCTQIEDGKWQVKLPPLPMLERTIYPFHFSIIAEDHYFTPLSGSVNVIGSNEVYVTTPRKKLTSPIKKIEEKKPEPKPEIVIPKVLPTKGREKSIEQIATELMEGAKPTTKPAKPVEKKTPSLINVNYDEPKATPKVEEPKKERVVESILPKIEIEKKDEPKVGEKDEAARRVLKEMGIKVDSVKPKARFSVLN